MGITEELHYDEEEDESCSDKSDSDYSQDDPSFDLVQETRSILSKLSVERKSRCRIVEDNEAIPDVVEMDVPELGEEDQKSFEAVRKMIEVGQLEKLKVDQCKVYLRNYGLRLTGKKETLIKRINEHLSILDGSGEMKYPASSFILNCKGDACTGDIVMFEQIVYEMFNIASRSANGPPCGTRTIAGRIVKESYGAAKQQHTFTIEVLWSKGVKPVPPLHPLLIKGRNLYRLNTMRQKWESEGKRQQILSEKHTRGSLARSSREVRIQQKEMRKMIKGNRVPKMGNQKQKEEETIVQPFQSLSVDSQILGSQLQQQKTKHNSQEILHRLPGFTPHANIQAERIHQRQHLTSFPVRSSFQNQNHGQNMAPIPSSYLLQRRQGHNQNINCNPLMDPSRRPLASINCLIQTGDSHSLEHSVVGTSLFKNQNYEQNRNQFQKQGFEQKQPCRFYTQGRCYYGDHCKYLHENRGEQNLWSKKK